MEKISEVLQRERGEVATEERVMVDDEDGFAGEGCHAGEYGFFEAGTDHN